MFLIAILSYLFIAEADNKTAITMAMNADERSDNGQKLIESFVNSNLCKEEMKQVKVGMNDRKIRINNEINNEVDEWNLIF